MAAPLERPTRALKGRPAGRRALKRLQRRALAVFHITVRHETTPLYTGICNDFRVERVVKMLPN